MRQGVMTAVLATLLPLAAEAQVSWLELPEIQRRLAAGEVVVRDTLDGGESRRPVTAAVRIKAAPEAIWNVMTDCERAASFVPDLRRCRRLESAADGAWELIEHEVQYSWFLPTIRYVFRADYQRPWRIDFRRVSGDLKDQKGTWLLEATPEGSATIVLYELYVDPGFWVPQAWVRHALRHDLPALLEALRTRVEGIESARR